MGSPVIPALHYRDPRAAIDLLCDGLGFRRHAVHEDDQGRIAHAELTFGDAMVMLGTYDPSASAYQRAVTTPEDAGGPTMSVYLVVDDDATVDALAERVRAAGAAIVLEPEDQSYGGRNMTCRDHEGHLWNVGSYDPWAPDA